MKKRQILLPIVVIILATVLFICGNVFAYMFKQSEAVENAFVPAKVACTVLETFDGTQKTSIEVTNDTNKGSNIDAYIRVRLVSYWADAKGNIVAKPSAVPAFSLGAGWVKGSNDTYYYMYPVAAGGKTGNLLASSLTLSEVDEDGNRQVVEVFAEAIQSEPKVAVTGSWGVSLNDAGYIVSP